MVSSFIELSEGQIVQIIRSPSIDDIIEGQIGGVAWLGGMVRQRRPSFRKRRRRQSH